MNSKYKEVPLEIRLQQCEKVRKEYPDRAIVICEKAVNSTLPDLTKTKYLPSFDLTFGQFSFTIRKKLSMDERSALFFFIEGKRMIIGSETMREVYEKYKSPEDGVLYLCYDSELDKGHYN